MDMITDVLIVGTGVAGLYTALNLREDLNILMVSKGKADECNSNLAQGGISVARGYTDIDVFVNDTMKAGQYLNDINAVKILAEESMDNINQLLQLGVDFTKEKQELSFTREGAHTVNRIVHYKDKTGAKVEETLLNNVLSKKNVKIVENLCVIDVLKNNNTCIGAVCIKEDKQINIYAKVTVLATGGIGGLFKSSTNERIITGDGIAIALKNGIQVKNLNYIQFHPTALFTKDTSKKKFLISESVRGEGGKLINNSGQRFVNELLPRDVVSKRILEEEKNTDSECVYLDVSFMPKSFLENRFPTIYSECLKNGIDISKEPIPVTPAQHYFMGGIAVNSYGKTSMESLYAFGEVSCTGVHGANRLASNSLLEALVFSRRGACDINNRIDGISVKDINVFNSNFDLNCIKTLNKKILTNAIIELRGDIKNELAIS
ncbi:L-aspartate oxidase [Clostridium sp. DJ247]|uniref:L-aspartate oxidase n=1 Tax=Clostridium sp. DJ247 TaxID=2726188 RepID=UPI0016261BFF|nr:L-aspartate oxidase [Clostridium sp. DJ247]MBC2581024.1 L-aspartate oxidase [Clostridium sp. DJ247]